MTFCVLGENCSVFDRLAKTSGLSRHNPLCEGCRNRAQRELNLLRYDYVDLSQLIGKSDGSSDVKISRPKPESSPAIDLAVFTLRSRIAVSCRQAEDALRVMHGFPPISLRMREGYRLADSVFFLSPRVDDLARMPLVLGEWGDDGAALDGPQVLLLFGFLHRRARRVCGLDPRVVGVPGHCPSCSATALRRHDDDPERVWCGFCQVRLSREDYFAAQRMQFAPVTPSPEVR